MNMNPLGKRLYLLAALTAVLGLSALSGSCTDPNLPDPFPTDPQVGYLATLGKVPLFASDTSLSGYVYTFDDYGVGSPYALINTDGTYTMYFHGDDQPDSLSDRFSSFAIGRTHSDTEGQTWGEREVIMVRRNLADDPGLAPFDPPSPAVSGCGPGSLIENCYDSNGVLDPMVFETFLYYTGPGIPDPVTRFDGAEVPEIPSAIGRTDLPPTQQLARNGLPLLIANKAMTATDPVLTTEDDAFYNTLAGSFDPFTVPCDRKSFLPAEFSTAGVTELNSRDSAAALQIRAGPYPWESGGVSSPFVMQNPYNPAETLMYYTCTEEFGRELSSIDCEVRRIDRICVARLTTASGGRVVAERLIREDSDVQYASPYAPNIPLPNNIVVNNGNFPGFDDVGSGDPTIEISRTITGRTVMRMWYTGTSEIGAQRLGITGSFDGFDWDADDTTLRISTIVPTNPVLVQAAKAAKPASTFDRNNVLRIFYESTSKALASINMATIVRLDDSIPPTLRFLSPQGSDQVIAQGGSVTFRIRFEDFGGSGIDQSSFQIRITSISLSAGGTGSAITARNQNTNEAIGDGSPPSLKVNQDFNEEFPGFRFDVGDAAEATLTLEDFKISPPLLTGQAATVRVEATIFDRADISKQRAARSGVDITVVNQ